MDISPKVPRLPSDQVLVIARIVNIPCDRLWEAWTEPYHVAQWWGPQGFHTSVEELDLQPGGTWHYIMISPNGTRYSMKGIFRTVLPPQRLTSSVEFGTGSERVLGKDRPPDAMIDLTFEALSERTQLTFRLTPVVALDHLQPHAVSAAGDWHSSFDCLQDYLATAVSSPIFPC